MGKRYRRLPLAGTALALVAALAACGGGGSGGGPTMPSTTTPSTTSPAATPTSSISGTMAISGANLANATVAYSCGCSKQAGETKTNSSGSYTISASATAIPASPNPTYTTVPGRNYMIIGYASSGTQSWTMEFLGDTPSSNLNLSSSPTDLSTNVTDQASTAAALYIFFESQNDSDQSFDLWNFNTIVSWAQKLRGGSGLSANETALLSDVSSSQSGGLSLYPTVPVWNPQNGATVNSKILADLEAVHSDGTAVDPSLPTPCPGAGKCTGTPTP